MVFTMVNSRGELKFFLFFYFFILSNISIFSFFFHTPLETSITISLTKLDNPE